MLLNPYRFGAAGPDIDPYWDQVYLLAHFDGASFPQVSQKGFAFSASGVTTEVSAARFGARGVRFPSSGVRALSSSSAVDPAHWSVDFCIEMFVAPADLSTNKWLFNTYVTTPAGIGGYIGFSKLAMACSFDGSTWVTTESADGVIQQGVMQHVAFTREEGVFRGWVEGEVVLEDDAHLGALYPSYDSFRVGVDYVGNSVYAGDLDELRITVGHCRYSAPFTPPSAAFPHGA